MLQVTCGLRKDMLHLGYVRTYYTWAMAECRQWYLILGQVPIGTILNFLVPIGTLIFLKVLIFPKSIKAMHQKILFQVLKSPL